jgi:raffinose/stachyose/melibiose transport system permease protein
VQIWANLGVTMMIFISGLQTIPTEMYEAARIDGASSWQVFRSVTWPLLTPVVNTNLLLNIIGSLQAWQLFLVLLGYRNGTQVLGYLIFAQGFGQTSGSVTSALPAGLRGRRLHRPVCAGSVIGMTVQTFLRRREERIIG